MANWRKKNTKTISSFRNVNITKNRLHIWSMFGSMVITITIICKPIAWFFPLFFYAVEQMGYLLRLSHFSQPVAVIVIQSSPSKCSICVLKRIYEWVSYANVNGRQAAQRVYANADGFISHWFVRCAIVYVVFYALGSRMAWSLECSFTFFFLGNRGRKRKRGKRTQRKGAIFECVENATSHPWYKRFDGISGSRRIVFAAIRKFLIFIVTTNSKQNTNIHDNGTSIGLKADKIIWCFVRI